MATTVSLKPNAVEISGSTSGTTTLQATAVAGTTTLTLPAATDTLVGKATTDTLTNKTLTGAVMNGTLGATTPSTVAATTLTTSSTVTHNGGTANGVAYLDGSKVLTTGSALVFDGTNFSTTGTIKGSTTIGVGAATPSTSGAGITFPATQSASSDANTLDDYEEGTWTPVLTNGTNNAGGYFYQYGSYIKVGRLVTINCTISVSSVGSMTTGDVSITGLPFTSGTLSNANEQNILSAKVFPLGTSIYVIGSIDTSSATLVPRGVIVGGQQGILSSNVSVGSQLFFTGTYWSAS